MSASSYRSSVHVVAERLEDVRAECVTLLAIPAVHRAMLPPPILAELSAVKQAIAADLAREPDIHALTRLEEALDAVRALRGRVDEVVERARKSSCEVQAPPPPRWFWFFDPSVTVAIEDAFCAQLPHAKISKHGAGMLAQLEVDGTPLHFVARGHAKDCLHALSWMAVYEPSLSIGDGVIELAWIDRYSPARPMLQRAMLHLVTDVARRLRGASVLPGAR